MVSPVPDRTTLLFRGCCGDWQSAFESERSLHQPGRAVGPLVWIAGDPRLKTLGAVESLTADPFRTTGTWLDVRETTTLRRASPMRRMRFPALAIQTLLITTQRARSLVNHHFRAPDRRGIITRALPAGAAVALTCQAGRFGVCPSGCWVQAAAPTHIHTWAGRYPTAAYQVGLEADGLALIRRPAQEAPLVGPDCARPLTSVLAIMDCSPDPTSGYLHYGTWNGYKQPRRLAHFHPEPGCHTLVMQLRLGVIGYRVGDGAGSYRTINQTGSNENADFFLALFAFSNAPRFTYPGPSGTPGPCCFHLGWVGWHSLTNWDWFCTTLRHRSFPELHFCPCCCGHSLCRGFLLEAAG